MKYKWGDILKSVDGYFYLLAGYGNGTGGLVRLAYTDGIAISSPVRVEELLNDNIILKMCGGDTNFFNSLRKIKYEMKEKILF